MVLQASPEYERRIGIWYYATEAEGIGGSIKSIPADFVVREVTNRTEGAEGKYLIAELTKENWETHTVVHELSRRLRVSRNRIGFAGTKDKFALTTQKISLSLLCVSTDALAAMQKNSASSRSISGLSIAPPDGSLFASSVTAQKAQMRSLKD